MRISDWSSDVCSSDLRKMRRDGKNSRLAEKFLSPLGMRRAGIAEGAAVGAVQDDADPPFADRFSQSCRGGHGGRAGAGRAAWRQWRGQDQYIGSDLATRTRARAAPSRAVRPGGLG